MLRQVLAAVLVLIPGLAGAHSIYTNEPAGSTAFYNCPMTSGLCGMTDVYGSYAPYFGAWGGSGTMTSPPNSLKSETSGGYGNGQGDIFFPKKREVFMGFTWRTETAGYANNNNKLIFIKDPSNSFLVMQGSPGRNCKQLKWYQQERVDNSHVVGYGPYFWNRDGDGTGWFNPNVNSNAATACWGGPYMRVEIYLRGSDTNVSQNGIVRIWVNGVLSTNLTNVNQGTDLGDFPGGFRMVSLNHAWDGTAGALASPIFEQWRHFWEDLYISFPNCPPGCPVTGGGGGVTEQCRDGIDNDGDGLIDFPADPGCSSSTDNDEFNVVIPPPPLAPSNLRFGWLFPFGGIWPVSRY